MQQLMQELMTSYSQKMHDLDAIAEISAKKYSLQTMFTINTKRLS